MIEEILNNLGFESFNPMQLAMIDCSADNRILLAPTGGGKTLAFLVSAFPRVLREVDSTQTIIIAPSRELALQIENVFRSTKSGFSISCLYGGHSILTEKRSLRYNPQFIVATPGRLLDHLKHHNIDGETVNHIIFDEFDKLLDLGFSEEIGEIISLLPNIKYRTLTSATKAESYPDFISDFPFETIDFLTGRASGTLHYRLVETHAEDKMEDVMHLLCAIGNEPTILFCNFREQAERISDQLYDAYFENEYFHGGMEQFERERSLTKLRNGSCTILVSTDLAARGLDIPDLKHIIHYELPQNESSFVHRNGRTARVDNEGTVYVFRDENTPEWFNGSEFESYQIDKNLTEPPTPDWETIYIGGGKKDKINRGDIVGFLCQKGGLVKSDIGMIEVRDHHSFVAVEYGTGKALVKAVRDLKIKNMKVKINLSF